MDVTTAKLQSQQMSIRNSVQRGEDSNNLTSSDKTMTMQATIYNQAGFKLQNIDSQTVSSQ